MRALARSMAQRGPVEEAASEVRRSQESLARAQHLARIGSWDWDPEADVVRWSDENFRLLGLEPSAGVKKTSDFMFFIHPDDRERVESELRMALYENAAYVCNFRVVRADGAERIMHSEGDVLRDDAGRAVRMVGTMQDVTEPRLAERALREEIETRKRAEEARERALATERVARIRAELAEARTARLQEITTGLSRACTCQEVAEVVLTQGLAALYADAGHVALRTDDDMVSIQFAPGYAEELIEAVRHQPLSAAKPSAECIRTGRLLVFESREELVASYPEAPVVDWLGTSIFVPMTLGDRTIGALGIAYRDICQFSEKDRSFLITLALQCAQAMERARLYEAEQRERRLREEVLAIAAHDLRSPLTSITLGAAILERMAPAGDAGQRMRARAQGIKKAAERATALLHNLLEAASIEAEGLNLDRALREVDGLVAEVVDLHAPIAEQEQIRLEARPLGRPAPISCDAERIQQALSNLISNALKFTPPGGSIVVGAEQEGAAIRFSVSDTGTGIKPEDVPRLFDRYWQASGQRRAGAGLGLYIVKGIVEAHGGQIRVDSKPGVGTTFSFTVPGAGDIGGPPERSC
jgi:PAS domain S-box-containing protein